MDNGGVLDCEYPLRGCRGVSCNDVLVLKGMQRYLVWNLDVSYIDSGRDNGNRDKVVMSMAIGNVNGDISGMIVIMMVRSWHIVMALAAIRMKWYLCYYYCHQINLKLGIVYVVCSKSCKCSKSSYAA